MAVDFLPITLEDMRARNWDRPDFVFVTGDAYVDHPSFAHAILSRVLEKEGFRIAILSQPAWRTAEDFTRFGRPRYGFLVSAGNIDSMVCHYTAAKKRRHDDYYSPGGKAGFRPDRATIVYCNRIREAYGRDVPILIGGLEASLRRFAHYDYWDNAVRSSILADSGADLLLYGMGERVITRVCNRLRDGEPIDRITDEPGTCYLTSRLESIPQHLLLPSLEAVKADKKAYAQAFALQYREQDPIRGRRLVQMHGPRALVQNPPAMPLSREELDAVYDLPYVRDYHPVYRPAGGIPAIEEVKFSITSTRGCFGECAFCALTFHQGRIVTSRSHRSILREAELLTRLPGFKGYIHDVGGPTANFRRAACDRQLKEGACRNRSCLSPTPCRNLVVDHKEFLSLLRKLRAVPGVKKVFIRSGLRYDYIMLDRDDAFLTELCRYHVSGQLKVAPEHMAPQVLQAMNKPGNGSYRAFVERFTRINQKLGLKQYIVPYFMSSHPGCRVEDAITLAEYLHEIGHIPEQVQDFYPTPGTLSTCMFYTGIHPLTMEPLHIPRDPEEKATQRALLQYNRPANHARVLAALRRYGREDLIGFGKRYLVPPRPYGAAKSQERSRPVSRMGKRPPAGKKRRS